MGDRFEPLDCDTDILTIGKDTFTVERLKELLRDQMIKKFSDREEQERNKVNFQHKSLFQHLTSPRISIIQNYLDFSFLDDIRQGEDYQKLINSGS